MADVCLLFTEEKMAIIYDMAVGLKKGHKVTPNTRRPRPSRRKGVSASVLTLSQLLPVRLGKLYTNQ